MIVEAQTQSPRLENLKPLLCCAKSELRSLKELSSELIKGETRLLQAGTAGLWSSARVQGPGPTSPPAGLDLRDHMDLEPEPAPDRGTYSATVVPPTHSSPTHSYPKPPNPDQVASGEILVITEVHPCSHLCNVQK